MSGSIASLPLDTLVQILCKLNHGDLKQALLVSRSFHNAVLFARQSHFDFSTPAPNKRMALSGISIDGITRSPLLKLNCKKAPRKQKMTEEEARKIAVVLFPTGECMKEVIPETEWAKNSIDLSVSVSGANV
ncbi:uncharacterized protein A4U43_C10F360 [Asparagus officinalis]|uniref:F-box domain-containing protein n=1 Tax=Asparagus officinalis TaxID=4686 RepID=A0A5P1E2R5_ASPOF|nr:F-box protein At4g35930-like [Asparagus officinalis]ONK55725.1 uncharacterized protein A4U43_C10F360 [Asparagus officinalis]